MLGCEKGVRGGDRGTWFGARGNDETTPSSEVPYARWAGRNEWQRVRVGTVCIWSALWQGKPISRNVLGMKFRRELKYWTVAGQRGHLVKVSETAIGLDETDGGEPRALKSTKYQ